jgi:hypothetical protein
VQTRGNIWFFSGTGNAFIAANGFDNCTYENNCSPSSFSQANIDSIKFELRAGNIQKPIQSIE